MNRRQMLKYTSTFPLVLSPLSLLFKNRKKEWNVGDIVKCKESWGPNYAGMKRKIVAIYNVNNTPDFLKDMVYKK